MKATSKGGDERRRSSRIEERNKKKFKDPAEKPLTQGSVRLNESKKSNVKNGKRFYEGRGKKEKPDKIPRIKTL